MIKIFTKLMIYPVVLGAAFCLSAQAQTTYQLIDLFGRPNNGAGGPALQATTILPRQVTGDSQGNIYIAFQTKIYRVDAITGLYTHIAGNGGIRATGDDGPATQAEFGTIGGMAVYENWLYVAHTNPCDIRRIDLTTGIVTHVAGSDICVAAAGTEPAAGPLATTSINPTAIAADAQGNLVFGSNRGIVGIVDFTANEIRVLAGNETLGAAVIGGPATSSPLPTVPRGIDVDDEGNVYFTSGNRIFRVTESGGNLEVTAGVGTAGVTGDDGPALSAQLNAPGAVALSPDGSKLYHVSRNLVRVTDLSTGNISRAAGGGNGFVWEQPTPALETTYSNLGFGLWVSEEGAVFFSDNFLYQVIKLAGGMAVRHAGLPPFGNVGEDAPVQDAGLYTRGIFVSSDGRVLLTNGSAGRSIREIENGVLKRVGGTGGAGSTGNGGPALEAALLPFGITMDPTGNIYFVDQGVNPSVLRRIAPDGTINAVNTTLTGFANFPSLAVDSAGTKLYVTHTGTHRVLSIDLTTGAEVVIAGNGSSGYSGDGGPATAAQLNSPTSVALDADGNVYITDFFNKVVRKVSAASGTITTVAGNGDTAYAQGFSGAGTALGIGFPLDVDLDGEGNVYFIAGEGGQTGVWLLDPASGQVSVIAGGPASDAPFTRGFALEVDDRGIIYLVGAEEDGFIRALIPSTLQDPFISGVIAPGAFGAGSVIAPGGWFELYGYNFSTTTTDWAELFNGTMGPTSIGGVSVMVDGTPATLSLVSPGQINGQAGDGVITGNSIFTVVNSQGESNTIAMNGTPRAGRLLAPPSFVQDNKQYVTAILTDRAYAGPPDLIPGAFFRRVSPGEIIVLYGVGFGEAVPAVPAGTITLSNSRLPNVTAKIGGVDAEVVFAGLAPGLIGLNQFNITVPAGVSGDVPFTITVDGVTTTQVLFLAVE